jgi:hypothetical protein
MANICSSGKPDWLKAAVTEVVAMLKDGAHPLRMGPKHEADLVVQFEESFCKNLKSEGDWTSKHRKRVLEVAQRHGAYAAVFTIMAKVGSTGKMPTELDPTMTGMAGVLVQVLHCPAPGAARGRPCNQLAFLSEHQRERLPKEYKALLRTIVKAN